MALLVISFFEPHLTENLILQLCLLGATQPVRICDGYRGDLVPPGDQRHVPVRLIPRILKSARCSDFT